MKLNKTQIIVVFGIVLLTAVLYFLPKNVLSNSKQGANRDKPQSENAESQPESQENLKMIDVILAESIARLTEAEQKDLKLNEGADEQAISKAMKQYGKFDNKLGVAFCMEKLSGKYTNKELGMAYYQAFQQSQLEENKKSIGAKTVSFLKTYSEQSPDDIIAKCALADCFVTSSANPMNGIMLLRDVIAKDSTNETALLLLGQFAVKSGQIEKAISRFESLIRLYPSNIKYSLYLAQLFSDQGNAQKASETLSSAKKLAVRKSAIDSINSIINHLK